MLNLNPPLKMERKDFFSPSDLDIRTESEIKNGRAGGLLENTILGSRSAGKEVK